MSEVRTESQLDLATERVQTSDRFNVELQRITNKPLTVESIDHFAIDAVDELIELSVRVSDSYRESVGADSLDGLTDMEIEDKAFGYYELTLIGETLMIAQEKITAINEIQKYIADESSQSMAVIIPPAGQRNMGSESSVEWGTQLVPRLATLIYILENDLGISKESVCLTRGIVTDEIMRNAPYYRIEVPELNRIIYICDEVGNVSYVYDERQLLAQGIDLTEFDLATKEDRNRHLAVYPSLGIRLQQSSAWRETILKALTEPFLSTTSRKIENNTSIPKVSRSELDPTKGFWRDKDGKHYGSVNRISLALGTITNKTLLKILNANESLQTKPVMDTTGAVKNMYALEDIQQLPEVVALDQHAKRVATDGEWKGFYTNEDGTRWASINTIADKLGLSNQTITELVATRDISTVDALDNKNRITVAYSYESVRQDSKIVRMLTLPRVDKQGDSAGLWADENGNYWGPCGTIARKLNVNKYRVQSVLNDLDTRDIIDVNGRETKGYPYEAVKAKLGA